jgi:hypothetical protein
MSAAVDYTAAIARLNERGSGDYATTLVEAAILLSGHGDLEVKRRIGEDPNRDELNALHDALLDKVIAIYEGDPRVALFCALAVAGDAFNRLHRIREAAG